MCFSKNLYGQGEEEKACVCPNYTVASSFLPLVSCAGPAAGGDHTGNRGMWAKAQVVESELVGSHCFHYREVATQINSTSLKIRRCQPTFCHLVNELRK